MARIGSGLVTAALCIVLTGFMPDAVRAQSADDGSDPGTARGIVKFRTDASMLRGRLASVSH